MCHFQFRLMSENVSSSRINLHFLTKFETKSNFCLDFDNFRETLFMSHFFRSEPEVGISERRKMAFGAQNFRACLKIKK